MVELAWLAGVIAATLFDPISWMAIAAVFAVGMSRVDLWRGAAIALGIGLAAGAVHVMFVWSRWTEIGLTSHGARARSLTLAYCVLCLAAWGIVAVLRHTRAKP
jgi:hypothetical protein